MARIPSSGAGRVHRPAIRRGGREDLLTGITAEPGERRSAHHVIVARWLAGGRGGLDRGDGGDGYTS